MFITIILLLSWTEFYQNRDLLDTVDCFAGAARVAKISRGLGRKAVALDMGYHPNKKSLISMIQLGIRYLTYS